MAVEVHMVWGYGGYMTVKKQGLNTVEREKGNANQCGMAQF